VQESHRGDLAADGVAFSSLVKLFRCIRVAWQSHSGNDEAIALTQPSKAAIVVNPFVRSKLQQLNLANIQHSTWKLKDETYKTPKALAGWRPEKTLQ
jgi:hypothetical protein